MIYPAARTEAQGDCIRRSWSRCIESGLNPGQERTAAHAPPSALAERLDANIQLVTLAEPAIEHLYRHIARSSSVVLLADSDGLILRALGDSDFLSRARGIGLVPGVLWSEAAMGTNAIGTALAERRALVVCGPDHYLERNRFLTGVSAPIALPGHGLAGVLNVSSDVRVTQTHALALLETSAELIENRLVEAFAGAALVMRFHPAAEALGSPLEGLASFDGEGRLLACNRQAAALLGPGLAAGTGIGDIFLERCARLTEHARKRSNSALALQTADRRTLMVRIALPATLAPPPPGAADAVGEPAADGPALQQLDLGDRQMAEAIHRAACIVERDIPLLIQGETGTGKEVFARAFHRSSSRRLQPFVAVNCAAIPGHLIESELFGYVEGAFTGARREGAEGKLRAADGGTLFLDEIGDMPAGLQAVLLRVLETRRVTSLGDGAERPVDIAVICASHRPLRALMEQGRFRADLFFRLSGMTVTLPALRSRQDLPELVRIMLREEAASRPIELSAAALEVLRRHPWPGNLRQLRNALRLAVALLDDGLVLEPAHLPPELLEESGDATAAGTAPGSLRGAATRLIVEVLQRHGGNISAAARELGVTRTTLYRKLRQSN